MSTEKTVERHVHKVAADYGGASYKFKSPQRNNVPDQLVLMPGGFAFFIECKSFGEKPKTAQLREHERLRNLGFYVFVCDSKSEVEDAFKILAAGCFRKQR